MNARIRRSFAGLAKRTWNSDRFAAARFYGYRLRLPLLLLLGAVAAESLIAYGFFPLGNLVICEVDYRIARREFRAGHNDAALAAIRQALLRTREDPKFWILAAQISERTGSPEVAYCWEQADRLRPGSFDLEIHTAEAALRDRQFETALSALREVDSAMQTSTRFRLDAGELSLATGETEQARFYLEPVEASHPRDATIRLTLARWHLASGRPEDLKNAQAALTLLLAQPAVRQPALRLLAIVTLKQGDPAGALAWNDQTLRTQGARWGDQLERLDLLQALPNGRALVDQRVARLMTTGRTDEIAALVGWMAAHDRAEPALIWIRSQAESVQDDPDIGLVRAKCLAELGLWSHLRDIQEADAWPGRESERLMVLARACFQLHDDDGGRAAWLRATLACRGFADYLTLLEYLQQPPQSGELARSWDDERAEVWTQLLSAYPDQAWAVRGLLDYELAHQDLVQAHHLYAQLRNLDPANIEDEADDDRICLLSECDIDLASASLDRLMKDHPTNPSVATAEAYNFFRQGDFNHALTTLGALTPAELNAPGRAVYVGAMLAVNGPLPQARAHLAAALAQPGLLPEERKLAERSLALADYREGMAALLHANDLSVVDRARQAFSLRSQTEGGLFWIGQSVALARDGARPEAIRALARIDTTALDPAALSAYVGGVLYLSGGSSDALRYLELSPDLPAETAVQKSHRALEGWWALEARPHSAPSVWAALFAVYRGLDSLETDAAFWRRDAPRQVELVRSALCHDTEIDAAQGRLDGLLQHGPLTPGMQAEFAYSLLLQGRTQAARQRISILAASDLEKPEPALYYGAILTACGDREAARPFLTRAAQSAPAPEEKALALQVERTP